MHPAPDRTLAQSIGALAVASLTYGVSAFALGLVLGIVRSLWLLPLVGQIGGVMIELLILLPILWYGAGLLVRQTGLKNLGDAISSGLIAFAALMLLELAFGAAILGLSVTEMISGFATAPGLIGLFGQTMLFWFPVLRRA